MPAERQAQRRRRSLRLGHNCQLREQHGRLLPDGDVLGVLTETMEGPLAAQPLQLDEVGIRGADHQQELGYGIGGALRQHHALPRRAQHARDRRLAVVHLDDVPGAVLHEVAPSLLADDKAHANVGCEPAACDHPQSQPDASNRPDVEEKLGTVLVLRIKELLGAGPEGDNLLDLEKLRERRAANLCRLRRGLGIEGHKNTQRVEQVAKHRTEHGPWSFGLGVLHPLVLHEDVGRQLVHQSQRRPLALRHGRRTVGAFGHESVAAVQRGRHSQGWQHALADHEADHAAEILLQGHVQR
mmetsp:Transcript_79900/g.249102  ORF Transcript_79900/g.249102 Transcript_79900/m.249102 type:complete len:298 (+) Transcript_79900:111-1004(+)